MPKFRVTAECQPRNAVTWFEGWRQGQVIEAESQEDAQELLDNACKKAGSYGDPYYIDYGPYAHEPIVEESN